jgi:hypothetical protein
MYMTGCSAHELLIAIVRRIGQRLSGSTEKAHAKGVT